MGPGETGRWGGPAGLKTPVGSVETTTHSELGMEYREISSLCLKKAPGEMGVFEPGFLLGWAVGHVNNRGLQRARRGTVGMKSVAMKKLLEITFQLIKGRFPSQLCKQSQYIFVA